MINDQKTTLVLKSHNWGEFLTPIRSDFLVKFLEANFYPSKLRNISQEVFLKFVRSYNWGGKNFIRQYHSQTFGVYMIQTLIWQNLIFYLSELDFYPRTLAWWNSLKRLTWKTAYGIWKWEENDEGFFILESKNWVKLWSGKGTLQFDLIKAIWGKT